MAETEIRDIINEMHELEKRLEETRERLKLAEEEMDYDGYTEEIKTAHPDGLVKLEIDNPDEFWHFNVSCYYKGVRVGRISRALDSFLEALDAGRKCAHEKAERFDPQKRISGDDLDWWSR